MKIENLISEIYNINSKRIYISSIKIEINNDDILVILKYITDINNYDIMNYLKNKNKIFDDVEILEKESNKCMIFKINVRNKFYHIFETMKNQAWYNNKDLVELFDKVFELNVEWL